MVWRNARRSMRHLHWKAGPAMPSARRSVWEIEASDTMRSQGIAGRHVHDLEQRPRVTAPMPARARTCARARRGSSASPDRPTPASYRRTPSATAAPTAAGGAGAAPPAHVADHLHAERAQNRDVPVLGGRNLRVSALHASGSSTSARETAARSPSTLAEHVRDARHRGGRRIIGHEVPHQLGGHELRRGGMPAQVADHVFALRDAVVGVTLAEHGSRAWLVQLGQEREADAAVVRAEAEQPAEPAPCLRRRGRSPLTVQPVSTRASSVTSCCV